MPNIFTSPGHISGPFHTYEGVQISSLGNNIMHFFYIYNLARSKKINFFISKDTHLEKLFNLDKHKQILPDDAKCVFKEDYGGAPEEYYLKDLKNVHKARRLLKENINLPENFWVEGWFHAFSLMPDEQKIKELKFNDQIINEFNQKYIFLEQEDNLSLHYRGSDFKNHAIGWGDMRLSFNYYEACLNEAKQFDIKTINVFSDQKEDILKTLEKYKSDFKFQFISNSSYLDWYCLFKSKNLISSNSTFCWSAGLYNKKLVFQPKKFLLNNTEKNLVFPTDSYYNNSIVI